MIRLRHRGTCASLFALLLSVSAPARAEVPRVVTDIPPVHSLVSLVMGELGEPDLLLTRAGTVHANALRPSQARQLQDSDAVIWIGAGLSPWLAGEIPVLAPGARSLELMALPATHRLRARQGAALASGEDGHDHGHDDDHEIGDEVGHEVGKGDDPHGWLDPDNAVQWLDAIAELLADLDAPNAASYRDNAARARSDLDRSRERVAERLGGVGDAAFVLLHDGLGHFEHRFGLQARAALTDSDARAAGPRRVQAVRATLRDLPSPCLFVDAGTNRSAWSPLVDGLDARAVTLDPLGITLEPGPQLYGQLIDGLGETIGACLEGG